MIFREIRERLTGISCPIFGVSWNSSETERTKAIKIIRFLEDRRVLYNPYISSETNLYNYLKAMRIACRKFLNQYTNENNKVHFYLHNYDCISSWKFNSTLGELRGTFGIMLAQMAVAYGIDIEDELSSILPEKDSEE